MAVDPEAVATLLVGEWALLANERRSLQAQMEQRFRSAFPEAVAVANAPLQMRRQLAQARHAAGQIDPGDFPSLLAHFGDEARVRKVLGGNLMRLYGSIWR